MSDRTRGWGFVGVQAFLLVTLILLPGRSDWPTPGWLVFAGTILFFAGLALVVAAAMGLGTSLTPTPMPREHGQLQTGGLYKLARHPIYTGVLIVVAGMTIRSGSFVALAVAVVTFFFFNTKAKWEESKLAEAYPDYAAYMERTPRFFPGL